MTTAASTTTNVDQIRMLIEDRVRAIDDKDIEALMAKVAPGVVSFGAWVITHEHNSVPFDAESGRASLDLTP